MEADWEFELSGDAPVIDAQWSGFVDLHANPQRVSELTECAELPGLADALLKLNAPNSPVWTSKTDVFTPEHIDPDEMNASLGEAVHAIACYIDVLWHSDHLWDVPSTAERACKALCAELRSLPLRCCRIDIVVRKALLGDFSKLGATIYFTTCGITLEDAKVSLGECLATFAEVVVYCR